MLPAKDTITWQDTLSLEKHPKTKCQKAVSSPVPSCRALGDTLHLLVLHNAMGSSQLQTRTEQNSDEKDEILKKICSASAERQHLSPV